MSTEGKPRFVLRPQPWIAAGYVAAPVVVATLLWLRLVVPPLPHGGLGRLTLQELASFWVQLLFYGGGFCLLVLLALTAPMLVRLSQGGATWLSGKVAVAIGFAVGFLPTFVVEALPPKPHTSALISGQWVVVNGHRTWEGWKYIVWDALTVGLIGLAAALVFRLLVVKAVKE
jgi:hypothetical protein